MLKIEDFKAELESTQTKISSLETENQGLKESLQNFEQGFNNSSSDNSSLSKLHSSLYQEIFQSIQKQSEEKQIELNKILQERDDLKLKTAFTSETENKNTHLKEQVEYLQSKLSELE